MQGGAKCIRNLPLSEQSFFCLCYSFLHLASVDVWLNGANPAGPCALLHLLSLPSHDLLGCLTRGVYVLQDPVRKEVPEAVATCHRAGILVRMVTGDNIHTARHIAKECGILTEGGIALEGPKFRELPEEEMLKLLPRLQVSLTNYSSEPHAQHGS